MEPDQWDSVQGLEGLLVTVQEIKRLVTLRLDLGNTLLGAAEEGAVAAEALGDWPGLAPRSDMGYQTPLCLPLPPLQKSSYLWKMRLGTWKES